MVSATHLDRLLTRAKGHFRDTGMIPLDIAAPLIEAGYVLDEIEFDARAATQSEGHH